MTPVSRSMVAATVIAAVALVLLIVFPNADLVVAGWFYQPGAGFPLARLPVFLFVMKALPDVAIGVTSSPSVSASRPISVIASGWA